MGVHVTQANGVLTWYVSCPKCGQRLSLREGQQPQGTDVEQYLGKELAVHLGRHMADSGQSTDP